MRIAGMMIAATLGFVAFTGAAQAAESWGINNEELTRFEAKVVDIACELTGNCPANCGDGKRQLGLLKADGTLVFSAKNADPFAGTVNDLLPYCGKQIEADGLLIKTDHMPIFALQYKRELPNGEWQRANWFNRDWRAANPDAKKDQAWFWQHEAVKAELAASGQLGVPGLEYKPQ